MSFIEARYVNGSSVLVRSETVGGLMVYFANLHQRFASDIAVVCPDTGRDLTEPPTQLSPPLVQVVVKPEEVKNPAEQELVLTFDLHARYKDTATCARAYKLLLELYNWDCDSRNLLKTLRTVSGGDIDIEAQFFSALIHARVDLHFALQKACLRGDESRVKLLISLGVPLEFDCVEANLDIDSEKYQPLCAAADCGHTGIVEVLIARRASVDRGCVIVKTFGRPLVFASGSGHADVVRMLLNHGAQVNHRCYNDWALIKACEHGRKNIVKILLSHLADPNLMSETESALATAASCGQTDIVRLLLQHKANINLTCKRGETALKAGIRAYFTHYVQHPEKRFMMIKLLMDYQAQVNGGSHTSPLFICARGDSLVDIAKLLLENRANVNKANHIGMTPLMRAAECSSIEMVKILLKSEACVNKRDEYGKTALSFALEKKDMPLVEILQHRSVITSPNLRERRFVEQSERESGSCSSTSVTKRRIADDSQQEDGLSSETSAKKRRMTDRLGERENAFFAPGMMLREKKMEKKEKLPTWVEDKKNEENESDASGLGTSAGKEVIARDE